MRRAALIIGIAAALALRAAGAAEPAAAELAAGAKLNRVKCAKCHRLYDPAAYDDAVWNGWMVKMKQKARLNDREYARLMAYFASQRAAAAKGITP
ncbi:MAG: hypothetical protein HZA91_09500 [Verrucomicrobia bacterium]|nr:hypothetical protein [Verrucomicrobiota bacterium]